jgi:hypothetical protein
MNFAVDLMMVKSMNKNSGKEVSTIYNTDGENIFCLNGDDAIKYYETVIFLKENNKESTLENVRRVIDIFLKEYDPFFRLLSPKKYIQSYIEHIEKLKKKRLIQVAMESVGFIYMSYQIFNSIKKLTTTSKLKYIPLIGIVIYVAFNLFNAYYANYTEKEYNIVKTLKPKLADVSGNVYVQIPEIEKINSKVSSLFYEMLKNKSETILKYVDNPNNTNNTNKVNNNKENIIEDDSEIGIEMCKLEEIERQLVPELFPQDIILIEIESNIDDKSVDKEEKEINLEDIKLTVKEELLEEIKEENEQEIKQEIKQEIEQENEQEIKQEEKVNSVQKIEQVELKEEQVELKEEPKKRGRQNNTTRSKPKQTKPTQTKSKQTKPKQQNKKNK